MLNHILVTLDGSELAESAVDYARRIIGTGGRITLLSVVDVPEMQVYTLYEVPMVTQPATYEQFVSSVRDGAQDYLSRIATDLRRQNINADIVIEAGDAATVITDRAKSLGVDAIVMTTHGRTGLSRWLFGSVTQKVLNGMPCPVFVVPGTQSVRTPEEARLNPAAATS